MMGAIFWLAVAMGAVSVAFIATLLGVLVVAVARPDLCGRWWADFKIGQGRRLTE